VDRVEDIEHPIIRECLTWRQMPRGLELASFADVPAGTGLGSSSAFTVGLLHALHAHRGERVCEEDLARTACEVEIGRLHEPIGKQDQYAAAYGGLNFMRFDPDESVRVEAIDLDSGGQREFERRLILLYLAQEREARDILREQAQNMAEGAKFGRVQQMVRLTEQFRVALELRKFTECGELLNDGWMLKRGLARGITNKFIESTYNRAIASGASGGKLLGAGGGGFLLLYCEPERQETLRAELQDVREMPFRFSESGSQVIYSDGKPAAGNLQEPALGRPDDLSAARN
jgi:D-glycero-alpha-D-manno-heptose-7-phosphate kinase